MGYSKTAPTDYEFAVERIAFICRAAMLKRSMAPPAADKPCWTEPPSWTVTTRGLKASHPVMLNDYGRVKRRAMCHWVSQLQKHSAHRLPSPAAWHRAHPLAGRWRSLAPTPVRCDAPQPAPNPHPIMAAPDWAVCLDPLGWPNAPAPTAPPPPAAAPPCSTGTPAHPSSPPVP